MKGRSIPYLPQEIAWIEARKEMPRRELHTLFCAYWQREDVSLVNFKALCKRHGFMTGRTGCFEPGLVPFNKGKTMPFHPNSAKTRFKKGQLPHNTKHLGHERMSKDGYVEISIAETNPHTGYERRYVQKHRHLWEQANGPVPKGHALKCLDGDKTNTDPINWTAVPRGMLPRLAGSKVGIHYDSAPDEIKPTIMAIARLDHAARVAARRKGASDAH